MNHYVYIIEPVGNRLGEVIKVGYSNNVTARLRTLQTGCPVALRINITWRFKSENDARCFEKECHHEFDAKKLVGEWFSLSADTVKQFRVGHEERMSQQDAIQVAALYAATNTKQEKRIETYRASIFKNLTGFADHKELEQ